jgi:hypothetical protein
MQTIKIKRRISSPSLRISELKDFIGKNVVITVSENAERSISNSASGILSDFKNTHNCTLEKQAWEIVANEKHGNN